MQPRDVALGQRDRELPPVQLRAGSEVRGPGGRESEESREGDGALPLPLLLRSYRALANSSGPLVHASSQSHLWLKGLVDVIGHSHRHAAHQRDLEEGGEARRFGRDSVVVER